MENDKKLKYITFEGIAATVMYTITANFLALFAFSLGADNLTIGFVVALPALVAILSLLPAAYLVERLNRKNVCITSSFFSRLMWIAAGFAPVLFTDSIPILLISVANAALFGAFVDTAWASLVADIVDEKQRGQYFSRRGKLCAMASLLTVIIAGFVLDMFNSVMGFVIIFTAAGVAGVTASIFFSKFPDIEKKKIKPELSTVFKNRQFMLLAAAMFVWQFGISFSAPFMNVYLIEHLGGTYMWVTILILVTGISTIIVQHGWGNLSDLIGHKAVIGISAISISLIPLFWIFASSPVYIIPVNILAGIMWAGFNLAIFNCLLQTIGNSEQKAVYTAVFWTAMNAGIFIAPIISGYIIDHLQFFNFINNFQLVFLVSFIIRTTGTLMFVPLENIKRNFRLGYMARELFAEGYQSLQIMHKHMHIHVFRKGIRLSKKTLRRIRQSSKASSAGI